MSPNLTIIERTNSSKDIVNIMLTKPRVLDIAQKIVEEENSSNNQNMTKEMAFTLFPSQNVVNPGSMRGSNSKNMSMPMNNM